jgi:hypothetical protein
MHSIHDVQRIGPEARNLHDFGNAAPIKSFEPRARLDFIEDAQLPGFHNKEACPVYAHLRRIALL